jgi:hypothetical protein
MTDAGRWTVPIACTLNADDLPVRLDEWKTFAHDWVVRSECGSTSFRLLLAADDRALVAAASLAQREKECCAFFEFTIALHADERWLNITVPDGAEEVLSAFAATLTAA